MPLPGIESVKVKGTNKKEEKLAVKLS